MISESEQMERIRRTPYGLSAAISSPNPEYYSWIQNMLLMPPKWKLAREKQSNFFKEYNKYLQQYDQDSHDNDNYDKYIPYVQQIIEETKQGITPEKAIEDYTKWILIANHVSRALRSENTYHIDQLEFAVKGIHDMLKKLNDLQINIEVNKNTFYRGNALTTDEFYFYIKRYKKNITYNTFQSASPDRNISVFFGKGEKPPEEWRNALKVLHDAKTDRSESDMAKILSGFKVRSPNAITTEKSKESKVAVLFHITVSPDVRSQVCFADVTKFSAYEGEIEVLFQMFTDFRVEDITLDTDMANIYLTVLGTSKPSGSK
jgi:hypothetical protein